MQRHEVEACGGDKDGARTRERREVEVEVEVKVEERGGLDSDNKRLWTTNKRRHVGV